MGDLTDIVTRLHGTSERAPDVRSVPMRLVHQDVFDELLAFVADQTASADRMRAVVRREVIDRTACVAGWEGFSPGSIVRMASDIADRVAAKLTTFEDGGKPRSRQTFGPRATQERGGHARPGATAQGAVPAAGNVAEPQLDPTPDRVEHPPSSTLADPPRISCHPGHRCSGWPECKYCGPARI